MILMQKHLIWMHLQRKIYDLITALNMLTVRMGVTLEGLSDEEKWESEKRDNSYMVIEALDREQGE